MADKVMYWMSVIFCVLALLLLIANTTLVNGNRTLQEEVTTRQSTINAATNLSQLNQNLAQALAELAVTKEDEGIRELLASQGITVKKNEKKESASAKESEEAPKKKQ